MKNIIKNEYSIVFDFNLKKKKNKNVHIIIEYNSFTNIYAKL